MSRPTLTAQTPDYDIYRIEPDGALPLHVRVIGLWDSMPATLLMACRARRAATLTRICPCCPYTDQLHNLDCPAEINTISLMVNHWTITTPGGERGRRLTENPDDTISTAVYQTIPKQRYTAIAV